MIIYNVTIKVQESIAEAWLKWLKEEHIPDVMQSGCFTDTRVLRLLETDDTEGPTYTIQYSAESKGLYNMYIEKFAVALRDKSFQKWGDKFIGFRSVMELE